ncbi:glycosyltransferase family A protein [uncultured Massilia sp.]|uniref:glycosyltransferase family 2 protein n=1 Tax=uncultured Massilia sp. TaxID=169973 RepID=UPI0025D623A9|nr:glycosyltransferase family A protein [uncultured Massilia sp.]
MSLPKVSIVIPSYKPEHFEQCLRSAIGQTYPNTEILVSDNCPTEAIREICARFPGVIYQRNTAIREQNVISTLFSGKGDLIKPLFDDDLLHPFCVERMVSVALEHPDVQLVFSASQVIDARNLRVETRRPFQVSGSMSGLAMQRDVTLGMRNFIGEFTSIMFRRAKLWEIGPHRLFAVGPHDCSPGLADLAAYINLAAGGSAFYIDEELSYFRRDPVLQSNSNPNANPNFGYCFSDYIDLLPAAHATGVVSTQELLAVQDQVHGVYLRLREVFPQIPQSYERYLAYIQPLKD